LIGGAAVAVPWFWATGSSSAMVAPTDDVLAAFKRAVDAFNAKDPTTLGQLLDSGVVMRKIHSSHVHPVIEGRTDVIQYLSGAWNGSPPVTMVFNPYYNGNQPNVQIQGPNKSVALVTGIACWEDHDGDDPDGDLNYNFQLKNNGSAWLVTALSGMYTHNPPKPCA
jgi:hypothetical protein